MNIKTVLKLKLPSGKVIDLKFNKSYPSDKATHLPGIGTTTVTGEFDGWTSEEITEYANKNISLFFILNDKIIKEINQDGVQPAEALN